LTVVKSTNITSFMFYAMYDLEEGGDEMYRDIFIRTTEGTFVLPSIVPDKQRFTEFLQQIEAVRDEERPQCSITVEMESLGSGFTLLRAEYDVESKAATPASCIPDHQTPTDYSSDASLRPIDESRITYYRNSSCHSVLRSLLLYGGGVPSDSSEHDSDS
jgi:hypothetical protein